MINDIIRKASADHHFQIEQKIKLALQPKPKLCPQWLWYKIIGRVLVVEFHGGPVITEGNDEQ